MITDDQFNTLAQYNHMLAGAVVVLATVETYPPAIWYVVVAFALLTGWKEFWYDYRYETTEVRGSSLSDFLHYQLGVGAVLALHYGWIYAQPFI